MMLDPAIIPAVMVQVSPEDFVSQRHKLICDAIFSLEAKNRSADVITVADELANDLDRAGGPVYLSELLDFASTSAHAEHHARIVLEKAQMRNLLATASEIQGAIKKGSSVSDVLDMAEQQILSISRGGTFNKPSKLNAVVDDAILSIGHRMDNRSRLTGVDTGFFELNRLILGWQPQELAIVAARPSVGKTALGVNCCLTAAQTGVQTLLVSLEMAKTTIGERILATRSHVNGQHIRAGNLTDKQLDIVVESGEGIAQFPLWIDDDLSMNVYQIRSKARRLASEHGLGLLVIDYLQIIQSTKAAETWAMELKKICEALKGIARELKIPVVALAQLKRPGKGEEWRRPYLSDLKESGATEEVADTVIFLHRPETINPERAEKEELLGVVDVSVAKQRNGPIGTFRLDYDSPTMRFSDRVEQQEIPTT